VRLHFCISTNTCIYCLGKAFFHVDSQVIFVVYYVDFSKLSCILHSKINIECMCIIISYLIILTCSSMYIPYSLLRSMHTQKKQLTTVRYQQQQSIGVVINGRM
jgi:hypothetical protein